MTDEQTDKPTGNVLVSGNAKWPLVHSTTAVNTDCGPTHRHATWS